MDYSKWKELHLTVTSLRLDPKNPRIPGSGETLSTRDIIEDLIENEKVYELAKNIIDNGYYPIEALIVVEENNKKFVVEGNRRLAALKLLLSPQIAHTERWCKKFNALAKRIDVEKIKKVKVIIAPSREAAAPVIMNKHTQGQIEKWEPLMQAKFYVNLIDEGQDIEDIADFYKVSTAEIAKFIKRFVIYSIASKLDIPNNDTARIVQNPRAFPLTNLERLMNDDQVSNFLGIELNETGFTGKIEVEEFKKGYMKIISDIANGEVNSRELNSKEDIKAYLDRISKYKPDTTKKGSFSSNDFLDSKQYSPPINTLTPVKTKKKKTVQNALIPQDFSYIVDNQRINGILDELKKLPVGRYPNAVSLLIRSLLEMCLGLYLDKNGHIRKMTESKTREDRKKGNKPSGRWHPNLKDMIKYIIDPTNKIITNGNIVQALHKLLNEQNNLITIETLNCYVHNQHYFPNETSLREFWSQLKPVFEIILVDPDIDDDE